MQNSEGISAGNPASRFGLYEITIGPVHILQNSNIIDLNLFDLLSNDQIIYARFNRKYVIPHLTLVGFGTITVTNLVPL